MSPVILIYFFLTQVMSTEKDLTSSCCRTHQTTLDVTYDCSHCGLIKIPWIPRNVTVLDLSSNNISSIDRPLQSLTQLKKLNVRENKIMYINDTVFYGLHHLRELDVSHNAFRNKVGFPSQALSCLHDLFSLDVDVYTNFVFDHNFLHLRKITILNLNPVSKQINLRNLTFEGLKNAKIKRLEINQVIHVFETGVFSHFPHLTRLSVTGSGLKLSVLLQSLFGLQNRTMDYIDFSRNYEVFKAVMLDAESGKYIKNICVKYLNLKNSYIFDLKWGFLNSILQCTETLIISKNYLGVSPIPVFAYGIFSKTIRYIDASWTGREIPQLNKGTLIPLKNNGELNYSHHFHMGDMIKINLTDTLQFVNVSHLPMRGTIPNITVIAEGLKVLDLSLMGGFRCDYGRVAGLGNMEILNVSGFDCSKPNRKLLHYMPNLTHIVCKSCQLSSDRMGPAFFNGLKRLKYLDLSDNILIQYDERILKDQIDTLEVLILRKNNITRVPTKTISNMQSLQLLDLRRNQISIISDNDREVLDNVKNVNREFSVLMENNPLVCSCEGNSLRFLHWLSMSDIIRNKESLKCTLSNGETKNLQDILDSFEYFQFSCYLKFLIIVAIVFLVLFICITLVIRSKYQLKYWIIMKQIRLRRGWQANENDFEYDLYISHHDDCVWTKEVLLKYLHRINDINIVSEPCPGKPIPHEIVHALQSSNKTIIVLTNDYLEDEWGVYALNMALMHASHTGRIDSIVVIFQEEIQPQNMPNDLIQVLWRIANLRWPHDNDYCDETVENERTQFWKRLFRYLGLNHTEETM